MISIFHQWPYFKVLARPTNIVIHVPEMVPGGEGAGQQDGGGVVRGCEFDTYCAGN